MRTSRLACTILLAGFGLGATTLDAAMPTQGTQASSEEYCRLFSKVRDNLQPKFGSQIDPLTRFAKIEVVCDHKAMVFLQDVKLKSQDITQDWVARRTQHWSKTYCGRHPAFASAIRNGWTISTVLSLADGKALRIDAVCHNAEA